MIEGGYEQRMRYGEIRTVLTSHFQHLLKDKRERIGRSGRVSGLEPMALENGMQIAGEADASRRNTFCLPLAAPNLS